MSSVWFQAVFAAAFVLLVAGILLWLRAADRKLARLVHTAENMERQAHAASAQVTDFVQTTTTVMQNIQGQLDGVSKLMEATKRIGQSAETVSCTVSRLSDAMAQTADRHIAKAGGKYKHQIADALDWAEVGYAAWQFWQTKRKENSPPVCSEHDEGHDNE
ncbi:DUF948 domain-containing protein [Paenibacillus solisilvae]|uniref:DUF948 domain-containing protein n=1 Tax=Paenibacillus solisilvae TaxID=2486751 RepID=A0ABW0VUD7_9BACL